MMTIHRFFGLILLSMTLFSCLVSWPVAQSLALGSSVFTVKDIEIDITADSSASAREKAFSQAQKEAFRRLTRRILRFEDASILPIPDKNTLRRLIQDFEIRNEKLSSVRYKANFVFRFKQDAVRNYFDSQGLSYTDVGSKPVLILPFYQSASSIVLWNDTNPWLKAWSQSEGNQGLVPVVIPIGDLNDVRNIGDDEALAYKKENLDSLVQRYDAGESIVLIAAQPRVDLTTVSAENTALEPLTIFIYRTDMSEPEFVTKITLMPENNETRGRLFNRGVARVFSLLQKNWKEQTIVDPDEQNTLRVTVDYSSLDQWVKIKNSLAGVQGLLNVKYLSISPAKAQIQLFFKGSERRLRLALAQEDMQLSKPRVNIGALLSTDDDESNEAAPLLYKLSLD